MAYAFFQNQVCCHPVTETHYRNFFTLFTVKLCFAFTALRIFLGIGESVVVTASAEAGVSDYLEVLNVTVKLLLCIDFYKIILLYDGSPLSK